MVERGCKAFDVFMAKHVAYVNKPGRGKYQGRVSVADVLCLVEKAFFGPVNNPAKNMRDHKAVGYSEAESGFLEWDPVLTVDHAKFDAARAFGFGSRGSQGQRNPKAQRTEEAREKMKIEMEAAGAAYLAEFDAVCPPPTMAIPRGGRASRNKFGAVVTERSYEAMLRDEEQNKIDKANSKSSAEAKTAAAWEKQRSGIRAVEEQLEGVLTPSKLRLLRVHELKSFIYSRSGHHAKASSNKDLALQLEAAALFEKPLLLPATPIAPPVDDRSDESFEEGFEEEAAGPYAQPSYAEEPPPSTTTSSTTTEAAATPSEPAASLTSATTTRSAAAASDFLTETLANDERAPLLVVQTAAQKAQTEKEVGQFL